MLVVFSCYLSESLKKDILIDKWKNTSLLVCSKWWMVKWVFFCSMYWGIFSLNSIFFNNSSSYKRKSNLFCILNTLSLDNKRFLTSYWELISITTHPTTQMYNILHTVYIECVIIANREEHFRKQLLSVHLLKQVKWRCRRQQQHP